MKGDAVLDDFNVVPVPRREMAFVEDLDDGYLLQVEDDEPFAVSKLGAQFLPLIDSQRTLGEIAQAVKKDVLADPEGRLSVTQNEKDQGRTFDSSLTEEAFVLIRDFVKSGAITFEPIA